MSEDERWTDLSDATHHPPPQQIVYSLHVDAKGRSADRIAGVCVALAVNRSVKVLHGSWEDAARLSRSLLSTGKDSVRLARTLLAVGKDSRAQALWSWGCFIFSWGVSDSRE